MKSIITFVFVLSFLILSVGAGTKETAEHDFIYKAAAQVSWKWLKLFLIAQPKQVFSCKAIKNVNFLYPSDVRKRMQGP